MAEGRITLTPTVAANGTATARFKVTNGLDIWKFTQISTELASAPAGATCWMRLNGDPVTPMIPSGDTAGDYPNVTVNPGDSLTVEWTGCTPGTVAKVLAFYDDGRTDA